MARSTQPYPRHGFGLEVTELKEELRRAIRAERAKMSERRREAAGMAFAKIVGDLAPVATADCVAAYVSRPTEPPTLPLLDRLAGRGTRVLLPVLGAGLTREWAWYRGAGDLQDRKSVV